MISIRTPLFAAALMAGLTGLTGLALAQNTPAPTESPRVGHMENMRAHQAKRHTQHLTELKSKLSLQASQEPAWNTFSQSMQPPAPMALPSRAAWGPMTTPERLDQMQAMKTERDARMQQRADAIRTFYLTLSADQKQVFDETTARMVRSSDRHARQHLGDHGRH
jgi:periplasmic protein CpxP/Spy